MTQAPIVFEEWAIVELMGHRRIAGRVSEQQIAGAGFLRVDIPDGDTTKATQFYAPSSVYAITPVTEEIARRIASAGSYAPVHRYELPPPEPTEPKVPDENGVTHDDACKCEECVPF